MLGTQVSARWSLHMQTTSFSKHFSPVFPSPFYSSCLPGPVQRASKPSPSLLQLCGGATPMVTGRTSHPQHPLATSSWAEAAPCLFPLPHGRFAHLIKAERLDLDEKPCSSVPNPPPHLLKSLCEQTGIDCTDELSNICCKPRAPGSREALAACLGIPGAGNYWEFPPRVPFAGYSHGAGTCSNK